MRFDPRIPTRPSDVCGTILNARHMPYSNRFPIPIELRHTSGTLADCSTASAALITSDEENTVSRDARGCSGGGEPADPAIQRAIRFGGGGRGCRQRPVPLRIAERSAKVRLFCRGDTFLPRRFPRRALPVSLRSSCAFVGQKRCNMELKRATHPCAV